MFDLINLIDFCKYMLIRSVMSATSFKQVATGATNNWKSCGMLTCTDHTTG